MLSCLLSSPFLNFASGFSFRSIPRFARFPSSCPNPSSSSMSGRTVADVLMAAARANASRKGQPPLKKAKVAEDVPKKESEASDEQPKPISGADGDKKIDLDVKILELKKSPASFDPKLAAFWKEGEHVPFLFLARAFDLISNESGRNAMTDILCNVFRTVIVTSPKDLVSVVYLSANKIAPAHEGVELGIKEAAIIKVLAEACGSNEEHIKTQMKELGDLGLVAKSGRRTQALLKKPVPLTVVNVLKTFRDIAEESGNKSQDKKRVRFKNLLVAASDCEPLYLVRLLQSKMRIGLAEQTVLVALGQAAVYSEIPPVPSSQLQTRLEESSRAVKQVYSVLPIYDRIVSALLDIGVKKLSEECTFSLGVPVGPMLAKPTRGVSEVLDKFQGTEFTCEYKYDGERAQIHYIENGKVEIYSRNAERNTEKFPDVVGSVTSFKKPSVQSFVLDCEVVAYDREHQKILPFQVLSTRARKDVLLNDINVQVCVFAFDILYLNGQPLLQEQLRTRREILQSCARELRLWNWLSDAVANDKPLYIPIDPICEELDQENSTLNSDCTLVQLLYNSFNEVDGVFQFATATISNELDEIQTFLDAAVNNSCEGLIIKTLDKDATYEPSKRSMNWLKLKKDYMDSIGDSLDLVPIAAFHGRGKRTGVYGAFLLACYDEVNEEYQSICKIGTGFSEAVLEERSASLHDKVTAAPKPYYRYGDSMKPDVWFEPSEVWEVKAADLSISPVHCAAIGEVDSNKGISLRFPRLLKIREDKNPDQATTSLQVAEMYRNQKIHHARNEEEED